MLRLTPRVLLFRLSVPPSSLLLPTNAHFGQRTLTALFPRGQTARKENLLLLQLFEASFLLGGLRFLSSALASASVRLHPSRTTDRVRAGLQRGTSGRFPLGGGGSEGRLAPKESKSQKKSLNQSVLIRASFSPSHWGRTSRIEQDPQPQPPPLEPASASSSRRRSPRGAGVGWPPEAGAGWPRGTISVAPLFPAGLGSWTGTDTRARERGSSRAMVPASERPNIFDRP